MGRRYEVGPGQDPLWRPSGHQIVNLHGVRERHWQVLEWLGQYAVLDTEQVAELMSGSRPAAVRHLGVLVNAGLVWRFVYDNDSAHRAFYELSHAGVRQLSQRLHLAGLPVPVSLGVAHRDQAEVNDFMIGLIRTARAGQGTASLHGWRTGTDVVAWLQRLGIMRVQPRAAGVWLQDGRVVRFLLHVDDDHPALSGTEAPDAGSALDGYRHAGTGVPAGCLLMLCHSEARERKLHEQLAALPLQVPVATTTLDRLDAAADPSGPVWTTTASPDAVIRLIDVVPREG